ncbi:spindle assembly abnormal protein 6 homolog [Rhodnius prolixus]|uniref:spindle assembly abnormal protein 6 homolog n=1 Tax=Rhodnius prolixus TaxID=13249 RepID=UPI003D18E0EE
MYQNFEELNTPEPLYSKIQRFYIKNSSSEEKQRDLRITVDMQTALSKVSKQLLNVCISDDEDPYFYYSLVLTNDDYQRLKNLQGLLVDFDNFPSQVIRLLEQCKLNESHDSKYLLLLEEEQQGDIKRTFLKIVETNNFKHLCHLILQIELGNDNDIKKVMLKKIKSLKDQNSRAEKLVASLENQLRNKTMLLESTQSELALVHQQWKEDRISFKAESTREISEETEKLRKIQLDWQIKSQREKSELEEKFTNLIKEKESEISRLRVENQILLEKRTNANVTITDQARRIDNLEKDLANSRAELSTVHKQNIRLEADYHEKDKCFNNLKTRLAVAEQESKDKSILTNKLQELLNNANDQKARLEDIISEKEKNIQRKQLTIQNVSDELIKANEIITKLQKEMGVVSSKLSVRTSIALEQEKVVEEHTKTIAKLEKEKALLEKKITALVGTEQTLKATVNELKELVEAKDKKIKDNERVIDWLNRRLSEQNKVVRETTHPIQGGISASSTPYGQFRACESSAARVPFSIMNPGISSIQRLEQIQNLPVVEEQPSENTPVTPVVPVDGSGDGILKTAKCTVTQNKSPQENSKMSQPKKPVTKKSAGIGFRRVSPTQTTPVPSSYFLK